VVVWGPLGDVLRREPSAQNIATVQRLTEHAAALLKVVRDTFPTYTMHDEQHAQNVVALMGKLAGPRIATMVPLEAALLILAAYFHDIGMVYSADEVAAIPDEEEFETFLSRDAEAFLAVHRNAGQPPVEVLERYCRSRHADRVKVHLDRLPPDELIWDGISITTVLQRLCRSHQAPTHELLLPGFDKFLGVADVRFCAMALRLADIMDFDRTRTPPAIHDYLRLADRSTAGAAESDRHWQQHLVSAGFIFPQDPPGQWPQNYSLVYAANPLDPRVEHDIRASVAEVRAELQRCRAVRDQCPRWRELPLPGDISTSQIEGRGYRYGEFRFEIDRPAVLELFTGEQLYEDRYAFLRELLQNAIDTVETRRRLYGDIAGPGGVQVSCWEDAEGFLWVRVDDSGMGMDEQLIRDYFLRVGRSYYNSAEFEAELLRSSGRAAFAPISRFGIGVLSCFMVGDRVEVSTRRLLRGGREAQVGEPLRLSLHRDQDYFVLRTSGQGADDMPADVRGERGFRRRAGTSVAVRIDPHRTGVELTELTAKAAGYVFAPPIPVTVNGRTAGGRGTSDLDEPWLDEPTVTTIRTVGRGTRRSDFPYTSGFRVAVVPLDLDPAVHQRAVRGQFVALVVLPPDGDDKPGDLPAEAVTGVDLTLTQARGREPGSHDDDLVVSVKRHLDLEQIRAALTGRSPDAFPGGMGDLRSRTVTNEFPIGRAELGIGPREGLLRHLGRGIRWAHGGIRLPDLGFSTSRDAVLIRGSAALGGRLRPDLTISRKTIVAVPFPVHSALQLAVRLAAQRVAAPAEAIQRIVEADLLAVPPAEPYAMATFRADETVTGGAWRAQQVVRSGADRLSVDEVLARTAAGETILLTPVRALPWGRRPASAFRFHEHLVLALLHQFLDLEYRPHSDPPGLYAVPRPPSPLRAASDLLPPLFAVPFGADARLAKAGAYLNAAHPLAIWISAHAELLSRDFAAPFNRALRDAPWLLSPDTINDALDRVAGARTDIPAPPEEAYVRADKNGWWWSR
jgi:hypothetical protein